jgi:hypothetical protein
MGCGAGKEMVPPPSPDANTRVEPMRQPNIEHAWVGSESIKPAKATPPPKKSLISSPPPADPDSVSQVQDFPGQLLQLDEVAKQGPVIPKSSGSGKTRPSSADKARPTTAGPKRQSKSRPSSAGRREAASLRPAVWLEPVQAKQIHEAEQILHDVFNRPRSAGRKNRRNKSPDRNKNVPSNNNRPSSAERTREGDSVKNSVWLTDKSKPNVMKINCDTNQNNPHRPGSAGRKRSANGLAPLRGLASVDQNGVKRPHTP